jgi:hypothetical protein
MLTTLDEIADGIYRISTFVPEIGPDGFTFNQFLLDAEEPLLYHTGMKALFPLVSREVARVRPLGSCGGSPSRTLRPTSAAQSSSSSQRRRTHRSRMA